MQIVGAGMHNHSLAIDRVWIHSEFQIVHRSVVMGVAACIRHKIPQIAHVMFGRLRSTVHLVFWVEMASCAAGVRSTAITLFMNMKAVFAGRKTRYIRNNVDVGRNFQRTGRVPFTSLIVALRSALK